MADPIIQAEIAEVDKLIQERLSPTGDASLEDLPLPDYDVFSEDSEMEPFDEEAVKPEADEFKPA